MSKQKKPETTETENPVEQAIDGEVVSPEVVAETVSEAAVPKTEVVSDKPKVNRVAAMAVAANKKMGVYKFLSIYPQDIYIATLLKLYYPHSFFTKDEWFQRIEEILNTPINN